MELLKIEKVQVAENAMTLDASISLDEWLEIGTKLKLIENGIQWWVGDWLNFGEEHFGEMSSQMLSATDYSVGSLQNLKWVAKAIPVSRRREELPFSAHVEVAQLPEEQQDAMLDQAVADNLSVRDIRARVKAITQPVLPVATVLIRVRTTKDMLENLSDWVRHGVDLTWDYLGYDLAEEHADGQVAADLKFKPKS